MAKLHNKVKGRARSLRQNPTEAERRLWRALRERQVQGLRFRRQHPIPPYVVDFACLEAQLVIEVDGGQHSASPTDERRSAYLSKLGWRVLRFWNNEVLENMAGVLEKIIAECPHPVPPPPLRAGEGARGHAAPDGPSAAVSDGTGHVPPRR